MIIGGFEKLEIGNKYTLDVSDRIGKYHTITFIVKRAATRKEYLEFCKSVNSYKIPILTGKEYFWEILTD